VRMLVFLCAWVGGFLCAYLLQEYRYEGRVAQHLARLSAEVRRAEGRCEEAEEGIIRAVSEYRGTAMDQAQPR